MRLIVITALVASGFCGLRAHAACGDKISVANGGQVIMPAVITWDDDLEQAIQVARIKKKPFAIYFTSKEENKLIGESFEAVKEYMQANNNTLPSTMTDVPRVIEQAREMGIGNFVKIPINKKNVSLAEKFGGEVNLLVVCTPTGEKLAAAKCTPEAAKELDAVKKEVVAWQTKNAR